jgi:choline-sulfatase
MTRKPNILLIMADQLVSNALPRFNKKGQAKTKNLSSLADNGCVFTNCYCNSPLCAPSRASLLSGTRISKNRVYGNGEEFQASIPTFLHLLRLNKYRTVLSGKTHFIGPDQLHGFERRLTTDIYPSDFRWLANWEQGVKHGEGTSVKKLQISGVCKTNNQLLYDQEVQFRALEFLRYEALQPKETPFFLAVSYTHPHEAFQVTQEYWDRYTEEEVGVPSVPAIPIEDHHPYNQWLQKHHGVDLYPPSEKVIMASRRAYLGMVSFLDDFIGEIFNQLKLLGLYENTIVIFTADHGEMLGEHGMWFKRTFFDESVKVPLIISWPGTWKHRQIEEVVSLVDLFPTIIEASGYDKPSEMQLQVDGETLVQLIKGNNKNWKNEAIVEYFGGGVINPMLMVRKDNLKYVYVHGCKPLLFDLKDDPHELHNLSGFTEQKDKMEELHRIAIGDIDIVKLKEEIIRGQKERAIVFRGSQCGEPLSWDYQPIFAASKQYVRGLNLPSFV